MQELITPDRNQLLAAMSRQTQERIFPTLRLVDFPLGEVLHEAREDLTEVYFPVDCIVSLLNLTEAGHTAEVCVVGNEGFVDTAVMLGADRTLCRAIAQSAGSAYCMSAAEFRHEFDRNPELRAMMLGYLHRLMTQMMQTVICNRHHTILQQLSRWLLMSLDRLPGNELHMTQELISNMLGVRREGVTDAAHHLKAEGVIDYQRGHIVVLDRRRLEEMSCECYSVVEAETDHIFGRRRKF